MKLKVSERATLQLEAIWVYLALEGSAKVTDKVTGKILKDIDRLVDHPKEAQVECLSDHQVGSSWEKQGGRPYPIRTLVMVSEPPNALSLKSDTCSSFFFNASA